MAGVVSDPRGRGKGQRGDPWAGPKPLEGLGPRGRGQQGKDMLGMTAEVRV